MLEKNKMTIAILTALASVCAFANVTIDLDQCDEWDPSYQAFEDKVTDLVGNEGELTEPIELSIRNTRKEGVILHAEGDSVYLGCTYSSEPGFFLYWDSMVEKISIESTAENSTALSINGWVRADAY